MPPDGAPHPSDGAPAPLITHTLKKRADFLALNARGHRFVTPSFILLMLPRPEQSAPDVRVGYTVTKKIGNAVVRNRIKRRLREGVRMVFPAHAAAGRDYVLIARQGALSCEFSSLLRDLRFALPRVGIVAPPPRAAKGQGKRKKG